MIEPITHLQGVCVCVCVCEGEVKTRKMVQQVPKGIEHEHTVQISLYRRLSTRPTLPNPLYLADVVIVFHRLFILIKTTM